MKMDISVKGVPATVIRLQKIPENVHKQVSTVMRRYSNDLTRYFKSVVLNGSGIGGTLKSRSGRLRRETVAHFSSTKTTIRAGVTFNTPYAFRHIKIGNKTESTIKPVRASMLAIPFANKFTLTPVKQINRLGYGSSYTPIREKFPFLFRKGSILFGKQNTGLMPFYHLHNSVKIKVRVFPDRIMRERKQDVTARIKTAVKTGIEVR